MIVSTPALTPLTTVLATLIVAVSVPPGWPVKPRFRMSLAFVAELADAMFSVPVLVARLPPPKPPILPAKVTTAPVFTFNVRRARDAARTGSNADRGEVRTAPMALMS